METQVALRYKEIGDELDSLGEPPSEDSNSALLKLLNEYGNSIAKHIEGQPDHEQLLQDWNELANDFMKEVEITRPAFISKTRDKGTAKDARLVGKEALEHAMSTPDAKMYLDDMRSHIKG